MPWWLAIYCSVFALWFLFKAHYAFTQRWYGACSLLAVLAVMLVVLSWV